MNTDTLSPTAELPAAPPRAPASTFGERFCVASSMGDGVLAHLASRVLVGVDVLFLDSVGGRGKVIVAPLARWTRADVDAYVATHHVIVNPLRFDGYPSVGCWPCTRHVAHDEHARSGRWPGSVKTECGIHS